MVISVTTLSVQPGWLVRRVHDIQSAQLLTNTESLVVVAENSPGDGQEGRVLSAVNEAITALLEVNVVNPDIFAGVL